MTQREIDKTVEAIKKVTAELIAKGPEACKQFLIDAGIIKKENNVHTTKKRCYSLPHTADKR